MKNPFQRSAVYCSIYDDRIHSKVREKILKIFCEAEGVYSLTVLGDPGAGKTSLLKHIKKQVESQHKAICININGNRLLSLNAIAYYIVQFVIDELSNSFHNCLREIAKEIYDQGVLSLEYDQRFDVERICLNYQDKHLHFAVDIDILKAILWTLDEISVQNNINKMMRPIAIKWLKGLEINQDEANILNVTNHPTRQFSEIGNTESGSLQRLISILLIIAKYRKIIFAFDEIESDVVTPSGLERKQVIIDFIKSLHDNLDNSNIQSQSSIVILSFLLPSTWLTLGHGKKAIRARLCSYAPLQQNPLELNRQLPIEQTLNLVEFWLKESLKDQTRDLYYPFLKSDIENFARSGGKSPRDLWLWCAANWRSPEDNTLKNLYYDELQKNNNNSYLANELINDDDKIVDLLHRVFSDCQGHKVFNLKIDQVEKNLPKNLKFQLRLTVFDIQNQKNIIIALGICQKKAAAPGAMLKELLKYEQHNLDRSYFLRISGLTLNPKAQSGILLSQLKKKPGGKGIFYNQEDIYDLYALNEAIKKYTLLTQDDEDFRREILMQNSLIKEVFNIS